MKKFFYFLCFAFLFIMPISLHADAIIDGTVTDSVTGNPIEGVLIEARRNNQLNGTDTTDIDGNYSIGSLLPGNQYTVTATATGYQAQVIPVNFLQNNQTTIIDFALVPDPGTISGTVTDSVSTFAIAGATVEIFQAAILITSDTTDGSGDYSFQLAPGSYQVVVSAVGFTGQATGAIVTPGGLTDVDFALDPLLSPGIVSGTVKDAGAVAIVGALVEIFDGVTLIGSDITIAGGAYSIPNITPGGYDVRATAVGFQTVTVGATVTAAPPDTTVDFVLAASPGTISGTVTDTLTDPIMSALVEVFDGPTLINSTLTDLDGDYTIIGLAPGSYTVKVTAADFQTATVGAIVTTGATTIVNFALASNPGTISGTVTDVSLIPIAGALVEISQGPTLVEFRLTDPSGNYTVSGFAPGSYTVEVTAAGFQGATTPAIVTEGITTDVDFALIASPGIISGIVQDTSPADIEGALVEVFQGVNLITSTFTDVDMVTIAFLGSLRVITLL